MEVLAAFGMLAMLFGMAALLEWRMLWRRRRPGR